MPDASKQLESQNAFDPFAHGSLGSLAPSWWEPEAADTSGNTTDEYADGQGPFDSDDALSHGPVLPDPNSNLGSRQKKPTNASSTGLPHVASTSGRIRRTRCSPWLQVATSSSARLPVPANRSSRSV